MFLFCTRADITTTKINSDIHAYIHRLYVCIFAKKRSTIIGKRIVYEIKQHNYIPRLFTSAANAASNCEVSTP